MTFPRNASFTPSRPAAHGHRPSAPPEVRQAATITITEEAAARAAREGRHADAARLAAQAREMASAPVEAETADNGEAQ